MSGRATPLEALTPSPKLDLLPFNFSIFDDADNGTVENTAPVYRLLEELGLRTTKSVWPLRGPGNPGVQIGGASSSLHAVTRQVLGYRAEQSTQETALALTATIQ